MLEGIGLIEKTVKNKIRWKAGNINDLQLFHDTSNEQSCGMGGGPSGTSGSQSNSNNCYFKHLPEGIGKNGVVFETYRPDDPKPFANRFKDLIAMR